MVPRKSREETEEIIKNAVKGVITFDFCKQDPSTFLVGAEGGLIVECSTLGATRIKS